MNSVTNTKQLLKLIVFAALVSIFYWLMIIRADWSLSSPFLSRHINADSIGSIYDAPACTSETKLVVLVKSDPRNLASRTAVRNSWGERFIALGAPVIFSMGRLDSGEENKKILDEARDFNDIVVSDFSDNYENLTLKSLLNVRWVAQHCPRVKFAFFTDVDVLVLPDRLMEFAEKKLTSNSIAGQCWNTTKPIRNKKNKWYVSRATFADRFFPHYCSGTGYLMSGDVPQKLVSALPNKVSDVEWASRIRLEDVAITGLLRQRAKVDVINSFLFMSKFAQVCSGSFTFHGFSAEKLEPSYKIYFQQSLNCTA